MVWPLDLRASDPSQAIPDFDKPVTVGSVELQLFLGPAAVGQLTEFGPLDSRDVAVAEGTQPPYFANTAGGGHEFRVYTAAIPGTSGVRRYRCLRYANPARGAPSRSSPN